MLFDYIGDVHALFCSVMNFYPSAAKADAFRTSAFIQSVAERNAYLQSSTNSLLTSFNVRVLVSRIIHFDACPGCRTLVRCAWRPGFNQFCVRDGQQRSDLQRGER